jgi:hypothetical protein
MADKSKLSGDTVGTFIEKDNGNWAGKYFFPSDDIPPDEKGESWHLAWNQALWSLFVTGGCYNNALDYQQIQLLRLYGAGRQPNGIYQNLLIGSPDINPTRKGWLSTNWEILSPAPKLHREIRGRFEKQEYDYVATAIDPTSVSEKEDMAWDVWYRSQYGKIEDSIMTEINAEVEQGMDYIAQSLEELELAKELGTFKLKSEVFQENLLEATDYLSDIKVIKQKVIDDLVDFGKAAFRDYYDPVTGIVKYEYVDWANLIIDYSTERDFKDIRFWGYLKFETINNIRQKAQNIDEADLINMAMINVGLWGNISKDQFNSYQPYGYRTDKGIRVYDQFRIPVLITEWLSTDTEYKTVKTNKAGEKRVYPKKKDEYDRMDETNKKNTKITRVNNVYQSTWVVGSKYIYDWGKSLNSARPNPKEPKLSIHAVNIPGKSIMETIKPNLDQIELAFLRWESSIAQAKPSGLDWDLSELENISLGGKKLNLYELINLARQTGDTLRRSTNLTNGKENFKGKAVNRNEGGIGEFLNEILITLDKNYQLIAENTGVDVMGSTLAAASETTATQIKYAAASTSDALQPLFTSWVQMKEDAATTASYKIQRAIKYNPISKEAYTSILGRTGVKVIEIAGDKSMSEYGIKLELRSNAEVNQAAIEAATQALKPGKNGENINLPDWWYFVSMINRGRAKQAMALLKYRMDKSKQEAITMQDRNMQMNGQNMVQQAQAKTEGKIMEINAQNMGDMKEEAVKALLSMQVDNNAQLNALKTQIISSILMPSEQQSPQPENTPAQVA